VRAEPLSCITCGDVAVVVRVLALRGTNALVELDGAREEVALELVSGVRVGDRLLCHAGVALARVGSSEADGA
jgi:hydrogenase maturation factor